MKRDWYKESLNPSGHADAEARRLVLTALPCATLVTWLRSQAVRRAAVKRDAVVEEIQHHLRFALTYAPSRDPLT